MPSNVLQSGLGSGQTSVTKIFVQPISPPGEIPSPASDRVKGMQSSMPIAPLQRNKQSPAALRALKSHIAPNPADKLGGAARRTGAAAQLVSSGKALNSDGNWRPSVWLRMVIDPSDFKTSMSNDQEHLVAWMKKEFEGAQIKLGPDSKPKPSDKKEEKPTHDEAADDIVKEDVQKPLLSLKTEFEGALEKFDKDGMKADIRPEFKGEFENPIGQEEVCQIFEEMLDLDISDVKDHLQNVVENIPFLGALIGILKSLKISGSMIMTVLEKISIHKQIHGSISVIEERSLTAVLTYQNASLVNNGVDLSSTLVSTAASATGTSQFTAVPLAALNVIHKVIVLVREAMSASKANKKLRSGDYDIEILEDAPLLGLMLPHLPSADPFSMLGIAPPGWQDNESAERVKLKVQAEAHKPENEWFIKSFSGEGVGKDSVPDVWKHDFEKMENMLSKTNKYLFDERWGLYKNNALMHEAIPQTIGQKIKKTVDDVKKKVKDFVKEKALSLFEFIKGLFIKSGETPETTAAETILPKKKRSTLPGQPMVEDDLKLEDVDEEPIPPV